MTNSQRVRAVITNLFPRFEPNRELAGQLDSLALFALLPKLEKEFSIQIFSVEANADNFLNEASITRFIESKLAAK